MVDEEEFRKVDERQKNSKEYESLKYEEKRDCQFKSISNHVDQYWEHWSTAAIEVQSVEK